jgi:hypothetical protein
MNLRPGALAVEAGASSGMSMLSGFYDLDSGLW